MRRDAPARSRSSPSTGTARSRLRRLRRLFSTELGYTNLLTALDLAGIPLHAADRDEERPVVVAGGHAAFNPEPVADFIDAPCSATARRSCWRSPRSSGSGRPRAGRRPGWPRDELLLRLAVPAASTCPGSTTSSTSPDGRIRRVVPEPGRRSLAGRQAHRHGPRRVALPAQAAGAAGRDRARALRVEIFRGCTRGCRFCQAGMITRPVRERSISTIGEMVDNGLAPDRLRGGRAARAVQRRPLRDRRDRRTGWPTATRAPTPGCRCPRPAWTPSTSRWPTSCPATGAAGASPSPPRAAASGCARSSTRWSPRRTSSGPSRRRTRTAGAR